MTHAERFQMATVVRQQKAAARSEMLHIILSEGECLKRAAWRVGISERTAKRYRSKAK
jgi:hypothetical protein